MHQAALHERLDESRERFQQLHRDLPDVTRGLATLASASGQIEEESRNVDALAKNVADLVQEVKADLMGHPTGIGQGRRMTRMHF